ncbi:Cholesterol oxidase [Zhongshania aliphaticivorans]|uniref:Cholesterol oxidase n=1 Tax=Zhongshania aliphaticivorans TaxID=1470434 RepID=A0A5S9PJR4_9GAMM|nr:GMC family oxidoreductase [Zhongshania aliphaticivorans]CAA0103938.1 Cholesterol oxidase [Zhongshania aliphaticivorans]
MAENHDFDVIIIGSGFGGSVSALRLSEKGYSVGVMEMGRRWGPDNMPSTNWKVWDFLWRPLLGLRGFFSLRIFRHVMVLHGNAVGGGSVTYANTLLVPPKSVWSDGSWAGLDDWESVMPSHYDTAKQMLGVNKNKRMAAADLTLEKLATAQGKHDSFYKTDVGVFFGDDDDHTGGKQYPDPYFNGEGPARNSCIGCGSCMTGCIHNAKNSLDKNYLYLAEKKGATVFEQTQVTDVKPLNQSDGNSGYEIFTRHGTSLFRKNSRRFTAKKVIFAASSLGTQELLFKLKQSGSMPKISDQLGNRVRTNAESLLALRMPGGEDMSKGVAIGSGFYLDDHTHIEATRYGKGNDLLSLLFTPLTGGKPGLGRPFLWLFTLLASLVKHPIKTLRACNPFGFAKQTIIFLCMQTIDGHLNMRYRRPWYFPFIKVLQTEGEPIPSFIPAANKFVADSAKQMDGMGASIVSEIFFNVPTTAHCMGGCAMGDSATNGVIDKQNQLFGYQNAYVCDGSMLGANLGVNPSLTITALTERAMSFIPAKDVISSS